MNIFKSIYLGQKFLKKKATKVNRTSYVPSVSLQPAKGCEERTEAEQ